MLTKCRGVHWDDQVAFRCKLAHPKALVYAFEATAHINGLSTVSILAILCHLWLVFLVKDILVPKRVQENRSFGYLISDEVAHEGLAEPSEPTIGIAKNLEPLEPITLLQLPSDHLLKLVT
jgi:hypothetical protein